MRIRGWLLSVILSGGAIAACSATGNGSGTTPAASGGGSGASGEGGASGGGGQGAGGIGAVGGASGAGGLMIDSGGFKDVAPIDDDAACTSVAQEAHPQLQPADIIWAIDTSCSMTEESNFIQANMNSFSQQIIASGIDVHVVLIAGYPGSFFGFVALPGICIDPPLGNFGGCANGGQNDTLLPHFFHQLLPTMQSTDGLNIVIQSFPTFKPYLRAGATHNIVFVTDDDASDAPYGGNPVTGAAQWLANFRGLDPLLADVKVSGIYCFNSCPAAANVGTVWKEVVAQGGGIAGDLCLQQFQPTLDALSTAIVQGAQMLDCQWGIPAPPANQTFDPTKVNVKFTAGTKAVTDYYHVKTAADCDPQIGGWYYDSDTTPTTVLACPASCTQIKGDPAGKIDVLFGCATKAPPPK
jgi:hypothetical protein